MADKKCDICKGAEWVCENHPDSPWDGTDATECCGGAGMPCVCNSMHKNYNKSRGNPDKGLTPNPSGLEPGSAYKG